MFFWYGQAAVFWMDAGLVLSAGMGRTAGWLNQELRGGGKDGRKGRMGVAMPV